MVHLPQLQDHVVTFSIGVSKMKVFAVAGMPGAGKSTVMDRVKSEGFFVIRMGDLVMEEARRRGINITDSNVGEMASQMRRENRARIRGKNIPLTMFDADRKEKMNREGFGYWATKTVDRILKSASSEVIFIDGTRGDKEIEVFRRRFNDFQVIAVHAPRRERYKRVVSRKREADVLSFDELVARDERELSWGLGNVIATADIMMVNDGPLEEFLTQIETFVRDIIKDISTISCDCLCNDF